MAKSNEGIAEMSDEQLMEEWTALGDDAAFVKERLSAFSAEHQDRTRRAQVASMLGVEGMDQDGLDNLVRLVQSMEPTGVESDESVGSES